MEKTNLFADGVPMCEHVGLKPEEQIEEESESRYSEAITEVELELLAKQMRDYENRGGVTPYYKYLRDVEKREFLFPSEDLINSEVERSNYNLIKDELMNHPYSIDNPEWDRFIITLREYDIHFDSEQIVELKKIPGAFLELLAYNLISFENESRFGGTIAGMHQVFTIDVIKELVKYLSVASLERGKGKMVMYSNRSCEAYEAAWRYLHDWKNGLESSL